MKEVWTFSFIKKIYSNVLIQLPLKKGEEKKIQLLDSTRSIGIDLWRKYGKKKKKKSRIPKFGKLFLINFIVTHTYTNIDSTYLWVSHNYKGSYIQLLNEMSWLLKLRSYVNLWKNQLNVIKNCNNFFSIKNIKDKIMNNNC